jgi:polyisoprenoid-binding protein YceI
MSADLFDVEKFPALPFKFTGVRMVRDGELAAEGNLTIHGLTRKVIFSGEAAPAAANDPWGNTRAAVLRAQGSIAKTSA